MSDGEASYVLADGRRVFHKRGMARALGLKSEGGNAFMKTMGRKGLGSSLPEKLRETIANPLNFKPLAQDIAHGYEADVLSEVAKAIVAADKQGLLTKTQHNLAIKAQILLNAFAKVGVVALIDEATGYQQIRNADALRLLIQQYVDEEMRQWEKEFPDSFYDELNRMYGNKQLKQTKTGIVVQNRPQHLAHFTRDYVYAPLENGEVLRELDRVNPVVDHKGPARLASTSTSNLAMELRSYGVRFKRFRPSFRFLTTSDSSSAYSPSGSWDNKT